MNIINIFRPTAKKLLLTFILSAISIYLMFVLAFSGFGHTAEWVTIMGKIITFIFSVSYNIEYLLHSVFNTSESVAYLVAFITAILTIYILISILSEAIKLFHNRNNIISVVISIFVYIILVVLVNTFIPVIVKNSHTNDSNRWYQARAINSEKECISAGFTWKKQSYNSGEVIFYCSSER